MAELIWQWQPAEQDSDREVNDPQYRKLLLPAIAASLMLHAGLAGLLVTSMDDEIAMPTPTVVKINFVPSNPLTPELVEEPVLAEEDGATPQVLELDAPEFTETETRPSAIVEQEVPAPEYTDDQLLPPPAIEVITPPPVEAGQDSPATQIAVPTIESMRRTIQSVNADTEAQSWLYECNVLDDDTGLRNCAPQSSTNFELAERNVHYEALNPVRAVSARVRSASTLSANSDVVTTALDNANLSPELAGYMREQLEAEVSELSNNGTRSLDHMQRMVDRSDAAQQARRILDDGWVRSRAAELSRRQVQAN